MRLLLVGCCVFVAAALAAEAGPDLVRPAEIPASAGLSSATSGEAVDGVPGSDCCAPHPWPGCDDPECQDIVCAVDPFCCEVEWDSLCAGEAIARCSVCGSGGPDVGTFSAYLDLDGGLQPGTENDGWTDPSTGQQWFYYPYYQWWNEWWPNEFDLFRQKHITIVLHVDYVGPAGYIDGVLNWAWPDWTDLGLSRPPLPGDLGDPAEEELYIGREPFILAVTAPGTYTWEFWLPFCPDWVSIDVFGSDVQFSGTITHICEDAVDPLGACCEPPGVCFATMTEAECLSIGGDWYAGETCPEFACGGIPEVGTFSAYLDLGGILQPGPDNDGWAEPSTGQQWFYYPFTMWWNEWWPNEFDLNRQKYIFIEFYVDYVGPVGYLDGVFNWTWPDWTYLGLGRPPLPWDFMDPAEEELYIGRTPIFFDVTAPGYYTWEGWLPFCPEWISIDVFGYDVQFGGTITHICEGLGEPHGACCEPPDVCFATMTESECLTIGGDWYEGETCPEFVCPGTTPHGACCEPPDVCFDTMTELECSAIGGDWYEGETCPEFVCPGSATLECPPDTIFGQLP